MSDKNKMRVKPYGNGVVGRLKNKRIAIMETKEADEFNVEFVRMGGDANTCQSKEFRMGLVATQIALSAEAL